MTQSKLLTSTEMYQDTRAGGKDYIVSVVEIHPGRFQVVTAWGRTGRTLQRKVVGEYDSFSRAMARLESISSTKRRRGYDLVRSYNHCAPSPETAQAAEHAPLIPAVAVDINCDAIGYQAWF